MLSVYLQLIWISILVPNMCVPLLWFLVTLTLAQHCLIHPQLLPILISSNLLSILPSIIATFKPTKPPTFSGNKMKFIDWLCHVEMYWACIQGATDEQMVLGTCLYMSNSPAVTQTWLGVYSKTELAKPQNDFPLLCLDNLHCCAQRGLCPYQWDSRHTSLSSPAQAGNCAYRSVHYSVQTDP